MATTTPITAARYNTLRALTNKVLGSSVTATPDYGYGQTFNTTAVTGDYDTNLALTDKVTAQQYEDLYIDLIRLRAHQIGTGSLTVDPFVVGDYEANLSATDKVELAYMQGLETLASNIETDRFEIDTVGQAQVVDLQDSGGTQIESSRLNSVSGNWNGTINHIFTCTFTSAQRRREFFNAGGQVRFSARVVYSGAQAKTVDWQNQMSTMGVNSFKAYETINNNSVGSGTAKGNFNIGTTYTLCYTKAGGATYARNDYRIYAQNVSTTQIRFKVEFNDNAPNNTTWGIDEPVFGDFYSTIELLQPDGSVTINGTVYDSVVIPTAALPVGATTAGL